MSVAGIALRASQVRSKAFLLRQGLIWIRGYYNALDKRIFAFI